MSIVNCANCANQIDTDKTVDVFTETGAAFCYGCQDALGIEECHRCGLIAFLVMDSDPWGNPIETLMCPKCWDNYEPPEPDHETAAGVYYEQFVKPRLKRE